MGRTKTKKVPEINWAVPSELGIPADPLRLRLDFFHQAVQMTYFSGDTVETKIVSAIDVATALSNELSYHTGLLPENTLWWRNTGRGPVVAIYVEPGIRKLALQEDIEKPPVRFSVPLPGLIFLAAPVRAPWIFAVKHRPTKETDHVFHAPLLNVFASGRSCPGTNKYPNRVQETVESFFTSFFSNAADRDNRSQKFPTNILHLWTWLNGKTTFPLEDLIQCGELKDIINLDMSQ